MLYATEVRRFPGERRLSITWSDGSVSGFEYDLLRGYCPCAVCQGHTAREVRFHPPAAPVEVTSIQPVGNYGLSIVFSDGHGTGIYRFDFLRDLAAGGTDPRAFDP